MNISQVLEIEEKNLDRIYLFPVGGFYKAYGHSVFDERFRLNGTRRLSQGFPSQARKFVHIYRLQNNILRCQVQ